MKVQHPTQSNLARASLAIALTAALAACGGGGSSSSAPAAAAPVPPVTVPATIAGTVTTPQYAANSAQLAMFNQINTYRQQCGFPTLQENTTLDEAAAAHATYMADNNAVTDTEVSTNNGFTGATYADRAAHFGFPTTVYAGGLSNGFYTNATLTETAYGQEQVYGWVSGVYHIAVIGWPVSLIGVGETETAFNGFPNTWGSVSIANLQSTTASGSLTFPCQGATNVPYEANGESPAPPNTSGPWGTPFAVFGTNSTDAIVLQSGTMTSSTNTVINLQVLDSVNDPNKALPTYEGVAYPVTPLLPNTQYSVTVTGTLNGAAKTWTSSFTTSNIVG